ncbi:hypothetical protein FRK76_19090 [Salmonella enterica]|nr:hypothetical protein [Salmonella enterica]
MGACNNVCGGKRVVMGFWCLESKGDTKMNFLKINCPTNRLQVTILHEKEVLTGIGDAIGELHTYQCSREHVCSYRETTECIVRKREILQNR